VILVADTSALLAILLGEPERLRFKRLLLQHEPKISAGTLIETLRVVQLALGPEALSGVDTLLETSGAVIVAVDAEQVAVARKGMLLFGRGRGEDPAVLNFGDLFAYALAKRLGVPLLYKGDDFARTDCGRCSADRP
jgi:ribonuclease VapC